MAKALVDGGLCFGVCVRAEAGEKGVYVHVAAEERGVAGADGGNNGWWDCRRGGQGGELGRLGEVLEWGGWMERGSGGEFNFCALVGGLGRIFEAATVMHGCGGGGGGGG